ncbi:helix-turn-helix domain-containing protein [Streptomyces sp. PSKA54]|uniref:Helix-turn-helix domain-containing protein n=1 Tax=Streptomyces himalayensis subsp. aureolus TaxID=2758039 RepID=A0A7W2CYU9_9ACTN|nr:helix-turn-helix transcriptional regulator [Streptomyces himalayensis]MBA4861506.1 helix-turn-helix domain-containing protein [Streptomyces himalayensis subsp. aureolus]
MAQSDMPTMRSRRLGNELRRLRIEAGLKVTDAAKALECGQPKVSQIENGKRGIRPLDLTVLFNLYGVEDEAYQASLRRLAREIHKVDWWSSQGHLLHDSLKDYLTLEADSDAVRTYEPSVLPGLLQTEAYMRAIFEAGQRPENVDALVETRMKRKELLAPTGDFRLRTVIDAPVLHRINGSRQVVREQLEYLLKAAQNPSVTLQVLPVSAAVPTWQYVPVHIFTLRGEPPADVAWLEHMTGGTLLEQRRDVQVYVQGWNDLTAAALSPSESRRYIRGLLEESGS